MAFYWQTSLKTVVLPDKMKYNLEYLEKFGFFYDIKLMFMTVFAVLKKEEAKEEKTAVK